MLIIDGTLASDTPRYSRSRFAARTYFAAPYSRQIEYASISNDVFPGLHADHVESPRDFWLWWRWNSPGFDFPRDHDSKSFQMAYDFFFLCPKWFRSTRVMVVAFTSHWKDVKKASIWEQPRFVPAHGIARIISVETRLWNHRMASLLEIYRAETCSARHFQILRRVSSECRLWASGSMVPTRFELPSPS